MSVERRSVVPHGKNGDRARCVRRRILPPPARGPRIQADFIGFRAGTALAFRFRVAAPSTSYAPRLPAQGTRYHIVRDHFETFRSQAASLRDGEGLPRFVEQASCGPARAWTA